MTIFFGHGPIDRELPRDNALLLYTLPACDRTRVEGFARVGAFPGPFQQRSYADDPSGVRSEVSMTAVFA